MASQEMVGTFFFFKMPKLVHLICMLNINRYGCTKRNCTVYNFPSYHFQQPIQLSVLYVQCKGIVLEVVHWKLNDKRWLLFYCRHFQENAQVIPGLKCQVMSKIRFYISQWFLLPFSWNHLCFTQSQTSFLQMYDNWIWKMTPHDKKRAENNLQGKTKAKQKTNKKQHTNLMLILFQLLKQAVNKSWLRVILTLIYFRTWKVTEPNRFLRMVNALTSRCCTWVLGSNVKTVHQT